MTTDRSRRAIRQWQQAIAFVPIPGRRPAFARADEVSGLTLLELALRLDHVVRANENLHLLDRGHLRRSVSIDVDLRTLTARQREALTVRRTVIPGLRGPVRGADADVSPPGQLARGPELPVARPPVAALTVTALGEHRLHLAWSWVYAIGSARRTEPLALPTGTDAIRSAGREAAAEAASLDAVTTLLAAHPTLLDPSSTGPRPVAETHLAGVETCSPSPRNRTTGSERRRRRGPASGRGATVM